MDFSFSVDHRVKKKENKKTDKYLDRARELKKLWNIKVTIIPIVVGAIGTVPKYLKKRLGNCRSAEESRPPTPLSCWDQLECSEESWKPETISCYSDFREKSTFRTRKEHNDNDIELNIKRITGSPSLYEIQRITLCETAHLLWRALSMWIKKKTSTQKRQQKNFLYKK